MKEGISIPSFQAVEKVACATFSRFSYLPCAYGAARELCRETLATQGFNRICRTCRQIRLKPKRAAIFHSPEVFRQAGRRESVFPPFFGKKPAFSIIPQYKIEPPSRFPLTPPRAHPKYPAPEYSHQHILL